MFDNEIEFDWHSEKSLQNLDKHGVTFEEANTVFRDAGLLTLYDESHSVLEDRFVAIGFSSVGRLLTIAYTERVRSIRIISARPATSRESHEYGINQGK